MKKERFKLTERVAIRMMPLERRMLRTLSQETGLAESVILRAVLRGVYAKRKTGILWK